MSELEDFLLARFANIRGAAAERGIPFELARADLLALIRKAGAKCEVTDTPFNLEKVGTRKPFAPSVDRIDCSKGYTMNNCRVVCVAANVGLSDWGVEVLSKLALNMSLKIVRALETPILAPNS